MELLEEINQTALLFSGIDQDIFLLKVKTEKSKKEIAAELKVTPEDVQRSIQRILYNLQNHNKSFKYFSEYKKYINYQYFEIDYDTLSRLVFTALKHRYANEDMIQDIFITCIERLRNYNANKCSTPYGYLSSILPYIVQDVFDQHYRSSVEDTCIDHIPPQAARSSLEDEIINKIYYEQCLSELSAHFNKNAVKALDMYCHNYNIRDIRDACYPHYNDQKVYDCIYDLLKFLRNNKKLQF